MASLRRLAGSLTVSETALMVLVAVILALFAVTLAFSVYAVLLRSRHRRRDRLWEELSARWEAPVLAALVDADQIPAAQACVDEEHRLHFVRFVLEYTRRVRGEERRTLQKLVAPFLDGIAARAQDRRSEVRTRAIQTLGTLGLPKYSAEVLRGLEDPSPLVSMVAARYLARPEFPEFTPIVMKHLDRFEGWNPRFLASMLAKIGPEASSTLRDGLADEATPSWLRAVQAEALRMQLDPVAGDLAAAALPGTEDRDLISALLRLLAAVGRPTHVPIIRELCGSSDIIVRAQALHALGFLSNADDIPLLVAAMDDESPWAALHAARGVREAGGERELAELAESDHPHARLAGQVLFEEGES
ncbi:MAG: HEAT repeat domain-containing protein [Gemmatimonadetes bacterium]|nr:HEAT repeat domain-containing protein [Gemmatimonadota bacterium]